MQKFAHRFKEPSSWAGIASLLTLVLPFLHLPPETAGLLVQIGAGVAGLAAVALPENK